MRHPMRVGIAALLHESNTFAPQATTLEHFEDDLLLTGEAVRERLGDSPHEVGGFFSGLEAAGLETVPLLAARALPHGTIDADAFDRLLGLLLRELERAGPLDGLLVAPHGATVGERHRDADGHWLALLRSRLGPAVPVVGTLDLHANLSRRMVEATDALLPYRTNPHLDQRQRGEEAAQLIARTLRGELRPVQRAAFPSIAVPIAFQHTEEEPCRGLFAHAREMRERRGILSASVVLGFPYADVEEMGSAALVVADADAALAGRGARELAGALWSRRDRFTGTPLGEDEALERASAGDGPVCLLDVGDNVGGGAPGDGTHLAHAIRRHGGGEAFICLWDPEAAREARAAGRGGRVRLRAGGRTHASQGRPIEDTFTVLGLHPGRFEERRARHGGFTVMDQGPTAVVRAADGLTVMLTSRRMPPFSLLQLTAAGLDPRAFRLIVAKGVHAPVAAYREVTRRSIRVDTPGLTPADMRSLEFRHRRRPLFPFER